MKNKITVYSLFALVLFLFSAYYIFNLKREAKEAELLAKIKPETMLIVPAIIDANNDITHVPTQQSGIIKKIAVSVGQHVKKGQLLFELDSLSAQRNVRIHQRLLIEAKNNLLLPEKDLKHAKNQLIRLKSIDPRAISRAEIREKNHEITVKTIQLQQAKHQLAIAHANLNSAKLALSQFQTLAPKNGIVLQVNGHPDEFVGGGQPIILLGDNKKIIVRVSIDERDISTISPKKNAYLTSKTYDHKNIPLKFIQLDRFILFHERLNSRVQEALYYFNRNDYPNFVAGQQVDVHIQTKQTS